MSDFNLQQQVQNILQSGIDTMSGGRLPANCLQYYPYQQWMSQNLRGQMSGISKQQKRAKFAAQAGKWKQHQAQEVAALMQQRGVKGGAYVGGKARFGFPSYGGAYVGGGVPNQCLSNYHLFIKDYFAKHFQPGMDARLIMQQAAAKWSAMVPGNAYIQYRRQMARAKKAAQRSTNPFAIPMQT
jgi:hypothetical protein